LVLAIPMLLAPFKPKLGFDLPGYISYQGLL
jgi:hypothetical protein